MPIVESSQASNLDSYASSANSPSSSSTNEPTLLLKFSNFKLLFFGQTFVVLFCTTFALILFVLGRASDRLAVIVVMLIAVWFALLELITLLSISDIAIDGNRISRRLWGGEWQAIRWEEIRDIRVTKMGGINGALTAYSIYARRISCRLPFLPKKMWFTDRALDMDSLRRVMNFYIQRYRIPVVVRDGGHSTATRQI